MLFIINNIYTFLQTDIITYCLSSIWIISFALLFCYFFNKKIKDTLVLSFIVSFILLFFGGLIVNIYIFYFIGWLIIIIFYILLIYNKKIVNLLKGIDIKTIIIYLVLSLFIFIYYQNVGFRFTDEFMHWGPMVKEMFKINEFYCSNESLLLVHKDYPPFFSLIELLFCYFGRNYLEKYLYIGLLSFVSSIVISISFDRRNKIVSLIGLTLIGFIFQYIPSIQDNTSIYNSIYIDYALSLLFVYVITYLISSKILDDFAYKKITLCFIALLLSKQIGILYFIICSVYLLFVIKKKSKNTFICFVMPIVFFVIWEIVLKIYGISGQFSISNFSFRTDSMSILKVFLDAIINKPLFIKPISINTLLVFISTVIILLLSDKTKNKKITIVYGLGFFLYMFTICVLYMFVFSVEEAFILSSFERYIISYVYIGFALITICICDLDKILPYFIYFVSVLLLSDIGNANINKALDHKAILVINQQGADVEFTNHTNGSFYSFDICEYLDESDIDLFKSKLNNYDYVYVYLYDGPFYTIWTELTNDHSLENDSLFYINHENLAELQNSNFNMIYYVIKYSIKENE